jgi:V/A-type H+-transporting ATPase subunit B
LELGWDVLSMLPRDELHRVSDALLKEHYRDETQIAVSVAGPPTED